MILFNRLQNLLSDGVFQNYKESLHKNNIHYIISHDNQTFSSIHFNYFFFNHAKKT